jgi:hypothetical protein
VIDETEPIARRIREAAAEVHAPQRLHAVVAEQTDRHRASRRRRLLATGGGAVGALAAVAVALVLVLGGGGPAIGDAAALALRPPTTGAPAVDPSDPGHVQAQVGGVRFPTYETWQAIGARTDDLGGRRAVTVAYRAGGGTVGYTIVGGAPLAVPGDAAWREIGGFRVAVLRDRGEQVITWEQGGRTCILAGRPADVAAVLAEAAEARAD